MGTFLGLVFLLAWIIGMVRIVRFVYRACRGLAARLSVWRWRAAAPPTKEEPLQPPARGGWFGGR